MSSSSEMQRTVAAVECLVAKLRAKASTSAAPTYQLTCWLIETPREGAYIAGQDFSERQSALLQKLDEILTKYQGSKQANENDIGSIEGAYIAGQDFSERQSALLQKLDEILAQYQVDKQANKNDIGSTEGIEFGEEG